MTFILIFAALGFALLLFAGIAGFFLDDPIGIDLAEDDREAKEGRR